MTEATTEAATEATTTTTAPHGIAWLPADADPDLIGHAQNAAWQSPADAVKSHRELQKMFGADRAGRTVVLPKDDATPEELAQFYDKLGRPKDAAGYKVSAPEGADPAFVQGFAGKAHELGLTAKQAEALASWYGETGTTMTAAAQQAADDALAAEHAQLAKDWGTGPAAAAQKELARRGAVQLGLDESAIEALEKVAGYSKTMKALAKMGALTGEHETAGMGEQGAFGVTPEAARDRKSQLMADASWRSRAMNANSSEWRELQKLDRVIAGVTQ